MLGMRFILGALAGGAVVYFCDPEHGAERRAKLRETWERNQEPIMEAAQNAGEKVRQAGQEVGDRRR